VEVTIVTSKTEDLHVEVDCKHTVEEASETRQYAEYELIAATSVDINEPSTGNTVTAVHESNHKEFEKIDVQVCLGEL
jgi:NADPH-dependent curcumin reductase CurA